MRISTKNSSKNRQFLGVALLAAAALASSWFVTPSPALANVSLKNGNFFIAYTDIFYPGGFEPKIERVYNSKTLFQGMFGMGWGNEYEVYLTVSADGSVVVHEYGGGAENRFNPKQFNKKELDGAVEMIGEAARKAGVVGTAQQLTSYKQKLSSDASFRNKEWENFRQAGKLQARKLTPGTQLLSNRFSYQFITKTQEGYQRNFDNGKVEIFNEDGKLAKVLDKNNNFINFVYGKDRKLQKIEDNFLRKMYFRYNNLGRVESIEGENAKKAEYKYNAAGDLIQSKDVEGNTYTFKYDSQGHRNLVEIGYSDKTTMQMAYNTDIRENIKSVKERDGTLTEYGYVYDTANKSKYAVTVTVKGADKKQISSSKYEYEFKTKATGEEWTYRLATTIDGERTDTIYNECCGLPITITQNGETTSFEYDAKGHVTKKDTPNEVTKLAYHPKAGKVVSVERYSKVNPKQVTWSKFQYDDKANLTFAKNSEGKGVWLFYDRFGRIASLKDQSKRTIKFKYNENSKPIEITDPAMGSITVSYFNSGEIKKVESTQGRRIALQVTSAFQNLLDIIRPAGVNLSF